MRTGRAERSVKPAIPVVRAEVVSGEPWKQPTTSTTVAFGLEGEHDGQTIRRDDA